MSSAMPNPIVTRHRFLHMTQPLPLPTSRGSSPQGSAQVLQLPFFFIVPARLLPSACQHQVSTNHLRDSHLILPPSLGDPAITVDDNAAFSNFDMAPDMVQILYKLRFVVSSMREPGKYDRDILGEASKPIRLLPFIEQSPPMVVNHSDPEYCLGLQTLLRKSVFKPSKYGRVSVSAQEPRGVKIQFDGVRFSSLQTSTILKLHFEALVTAAQPPKLDTLTTKLEAVTYYGSAPYSSRPARAEAIHDFQRSVYHETLKFPQRSLASVPWQPENQSFYAQIVVPVCLPSNKLLVPTFESCFISRQYILLLSVTMQQSASGLKTMKLRLPFQIFHVDSSG